LGILEGMLEGMNGVGGGHVVGYGMGGEDHWLRGKAKGKKRSSRGLEIVDCRTLGVL
jgi:hypothetical protein